MIDAGDECDGGADEQHGAQIINRAVRAGHARSLRRISSRPADEHQNDTRDADRDQKEKHRVVEYQSIQCYQDLHDFLVPGEPVFLS